MGSGGSPRMQMRPRTPCAPAAMQARVPDPAVADRRAAPPAREPRGKPDALVDG